MTIQVTSAGLTRARLQVCALWRESWFRSSHRRALSCVRKWHFMTIWWPVRTSHTRTNRSHAQPWQRGMSHLLGVKPQGSHNINKTAMSHMCILYIVFCKCILCGVQRVRSVLLLALEATLAKLHLGSYCVLPCESLHELKGYLGAVLRKLSSILQLPLRATVSKYLDSLWKKSHAFAQVSHIFASCSAHGPALDLVTCLVPEILYSKD